MDRPCPILPVPRHAKLEPTDRPWPARFDVDCRSDVAAALVAQFQAAAAGPAPPTRLLLHNADAEVAPGGYRLQLSHGEITCAALDLPGFQAALQTLRQVAALATVPAGRIEDAPRLRFRGFHLNFESYSRLDIDAALRLLDAAARFKLNALLVEYGPRFPHRACPRLAAPSALSIDDVSTLAAAAYDRGIECIPLQQSVAHLDYLLRLEQFAPLRERADKPNLLCPAHPDALPLVKSILGDILDAHPHSRFIHLGGDEARKIGHCPRCRPIADRDGIGRLYGRFMGDLARWVIERGRRPIIWDDTCCAHPDALDHLPRETIIAYWDYIVVDDPTPLLIPRMAHVAGAPRVAHDWRWAVPGRAAKLAPLQQAIMSAYSRPARLKSALGDAYLREFGAYLGSGFPKWIRALPYVEYYLDRGFDVITCPTGMGNGDTRDGIPNFARFDANIAAHARRCRAQPRALGILTTCWYDMPPELLYAPLVRTALESW